MTLLFKAADTSRASTVSMTLDPDLQGSLVQSTKYWITLSLACLNPVSGGGFRFNLQVPNGTVYIPVHNWTAEFDNGQHLNLGNPTLGSTSSYVEWPAGGTLAETFRIGATFLLSCGVGVSGTAGILWSQQISKAAASVLQATSGMRIETNP